MKPTVIASGNSENPQKHPAGGNINPAGNNVGPTSEQAGNSANANANARQFPQFQTGFGFDPDDDDIFSDAGLRSRLSRFREPFGFARKRCGKNETNADPYSRYFDDETDFFPNFSSFPGRRRAGSQGGNTSNATPFFDHLPSEFRQYIPDGFGFSQPRTAAQPSHGVPQQQHVPPQKHPQSQQHPQPQQYAQPQQQPHPQQYYEAYVQPSSPTTQPPQQKPKLCDAAIQTEDLTEQSEQKDGKNLKQYGMRNTVDLGQKSPQENCRGPRSQSAPPADAPEQIFSSQSNAFNAAPQGAYATASAYVDASAPNAQAEEPQQSFHQQRSQGTQPMTPPHPPPRQHNPHPQYQPRQEQQQQPQQQQPQQQANPESGGGFVRTVPIYVEGRSEPVISKKAVPPQQQQQQQHQQQQPRQKPGHPTPLNTQQPTPPSNQVPPQTPHTTECINKIQDIQRDVLDLMSKVEKFKGFRNDKEYMYLDEMLTRNLLKLDTIDTNGKDSIRLARREAIKCIQASINVLEAKSEENARNAQQQTVMNKEEQKAEVSPVDNGNAINEEEEAVSLPPVHEPIPLPPPPEKTMVEVKPIEEDVKKEQNVVLEQAPEIVQQTEKGQENVPDNSQTSKPENIANDSTLETAAGDKENPNTDSVSPKNPEVINDAEELKPSGGAVKKKIIKKKKIVSDKKDKSKSDSASPAEIQADDNAEKVGNPEQDPSHP